MRSHRWTILAAALAMTACIPRSVLRGGDPYASDHAMAGWMPAGWRTVAILPFGGDAALRRPLEELAWARLRSATSLELRSPYQVRRAVLARDGAAGAEALVQAAAAWSSDALAASGPPAEEVRALAARLGVDALLIGAAAERGTDLALLDGATGATVAAVRRGGSNWAAARGPAERAADGAARALTAMAIALRTPPGRVAELHAPAAPEGGPW